MNSPTRDNLNIDIRCGKCGDWLMWEAARNVGTGKIELDYKCGCEGVNKIGFLTIDAVVKMVVFAEPEPSKPDYSEAKRQGVPIKI